MPAKTPVFDRLLQFLNDLAQRDLYYTLEHDRDEAIMVVIPVTGERWEVQFVRDGSVEVRRFVSHGEISEADALTELLSEAATPTPAAPVETSSRAPSQDVARRADELTNTEFETLADKLAAMTPSLPTLPDEAISREAIYTDHP